MRPRDEGDVEMTHTVIATYYCHQRYGGTYSCSAFQYYLPWVWAPLAIVLALVGSHRGYRYRSNRRARSLDSDDAAAGEALLARSRRDLGLPPDGDAIGGGSEADGVAQLASTNRGASGLVPAGHPGLPDASSAPPPGWYPDPENPGRQRYWYGYAWAPPTSPTIGHGVTAEVSRDAPGWGAAER